MQLADAKKLALELMALHLSSEWNFEFNTRRTAFGTCRHYTRTICLSSYLTPAQPEDEVRDTILHEIAHALTPGHGHDAYWSSMARRIGANGKRVSKTSKVTTSKYTITCQGCKRQSHTHRIKKHPIRLYRCGKCGHSVLTQVQNY